MYYSKKNFGCNKRHYDKPDKETCEYLLSVATL